MNISIPDQLKTWAEGRVAEGRYSSTSDYVRDLVRRDQDAAQHDAAKLAWLRAAWEEGLASGEPVEGNFDPDDIARRGEFALQARRGRE